MFGAVVVKKGREVQQLTAVFDVYLKLIYSSPLPSPSPTIARFCSRPNFLIKLAQN